MPKISVIIPAYNAEKYIGQCLESVQGQTLEDIEIIVVDDGSTDDTPRIVEALAQGDDRVTLVCQQNQFAGVARNNGMDRAKGEFLYFLDADDFVEPNCLELMADAAKAYDADIVVARSFYQDEQDGNRGFLDWTVTNVKTIKDGVTLSRDDLASKLFQSFAGWPWDKLFRASYVADTGLRFQDLRTTNDALFVFCAMAQANTVACLDEHLVTHRIHNEASLEGTRQKSWRCAVDAAAAIREELERRGLLDAFRRSYENWIAYFFAWNLMTLDEDTAQPFLEAAAPILETLSADEAEFDHPNDAFFVRSVRLDRARLIVEANRLRKKVTDLTNDNSWLQGNCAQLEERLEEQRNALLEEKERLTDENARLAQEKRAVYESASYRVGHVLIAPLGAVKRALRKRA